MKLTKIKIQNYRQYKDVEITFNTNPNQNFTVIKGNNGTGKTTLLNAFTWCLYGKEIHSYGHETAMPLCNNKAINLAEPNEDIPVSVSLYFLDDKKRQYVFERDINFYKTSSGVIKHSDKTTFKVTKPKGNDIVVKYDDHYTVKKFIPKSIQEYFFFDGARLGEYFQVTSNQNIKNAVFEISQLNLIENLKYNLDNVIKTYISNQKKLNPQTAEIQKNIHRYEQEIESKQNDIKKYKKEIEDANNEIESINEQLIGLDEKAVIKAVEDEKKLTKEITSIDLKLNGEDNKGGIKQKRVQSIIKHYPLFLLSDYFFNFLELGEESREKGFIPPKYKKSFIEDLINDGKCICGIDLNEHPEHKKILEELKDKTNDITNESEYITSVLTNIRETILKHELKPYKEEILKLNREILDLEDKLEDKSEKLKNVRAIIETNPIKEIKKLSQIKKDLRDIISNNNRLIGTYENQINVTEKQLNDKKKKLVIAQSDEIESAKIDEKIEFTKKAKRSADLLYNNLSNEIKNEIQKLTKDKFTKIQWKENEFVDIKLNEEYDISIINKIGNIEKPGDLSDGEKLSLGLCFMSALHKISGFELPIIMDTPLGNLDVDIRQNIAKFLPEFVGNKQMILLVTSTEYTDDFREILYEHVGNEYVIKWNNSNEGKESTVE